jgi:hypothetical protein
MNGLLGDGIDPIAMGLLSAGGALMTPRQQGGGVGPAMTQAGQAIMQGRMMQEQARRQREQDALRAQLMQAQIGKYQSDADDDKRKRELEKQLQAAARRAFTPASAGSLGGGVTPGSQQGQMLLGQMSGDPEFDSAMLGSTNSALNSVGPQQAVSAPTAGGFDQQRFLSGLAQVAPLEALKLSQQQKADNPFGKIDPKDYTPESLRRFVQTGSAADLVPVRKREFVNGVAVDAYNATPGDVARNPDELAQKLVVPDGKGGYAINPLALQAKTSVARAGAPSTTLRVENKAGDSLAGQVGGIVNETRLKATGALKTVETTDQMLAALNRGGAFIGPGATAKTAIARLSTALGVAGQDTQEKLRNTRQLVQGLAKIGLAAREQLRGTGTITDSENAALEKAESGNIDEMTEGELRDLISVSRKSAALAIESHRANLGSMAQNPATAASARFYEIQGLDDVYKRLQTPLQQPAPPPAVQSGGQAPAPAGPTRMQFDSQGNRIR